MEKLNRLSKLKLKIAEAILSDRDIVNLISDRTDLELPALELNWVRVFPFAKVPDVTEGANTYVTYNIGTDGIDNPAVKDYYLTLYVFGHEGIQRIDDVVGERLGIEDRGVRVDILADKVDLLLNGEHGFGFGRLEIVGDHPYTFAEHFTGRRLVYKVKGWNRFGGQLV